MMRRIAFALAFAFCALASAATEKEVLDITKKASEGQKPFLEELINLSRAGDAFAAHNLGNLYLVGRGVPRSEARAIEQFHLGAVRGRIDSAHNLAVTFQRGPDSVRDLKAARGWFQLAAEKGYARSQANLGEMLLEGSGGPADAAAGRGWIEKAAAQGEPRGLYLLGMLNLEKDAEAAAKFILLAAEGKDRDAQYRLALLFGTGQGVPKSDALALKWLGEAAAQRLPEAEYLLAGVYAKGLYGEARNETTAVKWLRFAARQGHVEANYALGLAYAEGRGVAQNASEAMGWMLQAARKGHPQANEFVRQVLSKTTPIQPAPKEEDKK